MNIEYINIYIYINKDTQGHIYNTTTSFTHMKPTQKKQYLYRHLCLHIT